MKTPGNLAELLENLQRVEGVLACGACLGNSLVVYRHRPDYPISRDQAKVVWKSVKETFHHLINHKLPADHLHWTFGHFNLHAVYRNAVAVGIMVDKSISATAYQQVEAALESFSDVDVDEAVATEPPPTPPTLLAEPIRKRMSRELTVKELPCA